MLKKMISKINYSVACTALAVASLVAGPATELCTIIMLDDLEMPSSLLKTE